MHLSQKKKVDSVSLVHHVWTFCLLFQDRVFQEKPRIISLVLHNKQYTGAITSSLASVKQTVQMTRTFKCQTEVTTVTQNCINLPTAVLEHMLTKLEC